MSAATTKIFFIAEIFLVTASRKQNRAGGLYCLVLSAFPPKALNVLYATGRSSGLALLFFPSLNGAAEVVLKNSLSKATG
jgi:hypothetical protein